MLVLSRKKSESVTVTVGDVEVIVMVTEIRGDKVRIGFKAPDDVEIWRTEVQEANPEILAFRRSSQTSPTAA